MIHEKLASVGQLATGIAHELYNPLNFIRTNMACLEEYLADFAALLRCYEDLAENCCRQALLPELTQGIASQRQRIKYDNISDETMKIFKENYSGFERINEVVNILRNFTSAGFDDQMDDFDLNLAIGDTIMLSRNITEHGISIETDLAVLPQLSGNSVLIKQALLNVLINSIQAINSRLHEADGQITIRTFTDSKHVGCVVEDNGPGIPEQEQARIFDPFFTTNEPGSGKGLGLSTTYDIIVNKHGGKISCVCPPQGGTIITLLLPLAKPPQGGRDD
jgi:signal transduction histidine kinase